MLTLLFLLTLWVLAGIGSVIASEYNYAFDRWLDSHEQLAAWVALPLLAIFMLLPYDAAAAEPGRPTWRKLARLLFLGEPIDDPRA